MTSIVDVITQMPRCEDCRYWQPRPEIAPRGVCAAADYSRHPASLAIALDKTDPDYPADLLTCPEFGCVQFSAVQSDKSSLT